MIDLDLFAGPGGWDEGGRVLGLAPLGLEWDSAACRTAVAAGHARLQTDVARPPLDLGRLRVRGLIASPPCQTFSLAGKGAGRDALPELQGAVERVWRGATPAQVCPADLDVRSTLVLEPVRYARDLRPEWLALEQVPAVLPIWQSLRVLLREAGYSAWCGVLNSADYGVPQTRVRAVLIASRTRRVQPPPPTHSRGGGEPDLFGEALPAWRSMAEALGWDSADRVGWARHPDKDERNQALDEDGKRARDWRLAGGPAATLTGKARSWERRPASFVAAGVTGEGRPKDPEVQPADTITGKGTAYWLRMGSQSNQALRVSVQEAAVLQSFPADYPWQGSRTKQYEQVGNACPPRLSAHVLAAATGLPAPTYEDSR